MDSTSSGGCFSSTFARPIFTATHTHPHARSFVRKFAGPSLVSPLCALPHPSLGTQLFLSHGSIFVFPRLDHCDTIRCRVAPIAAIDAPGTARHSVRFPLLLRVQSPLRRGTARVAGILLGVARLPCLRGLSHLHGRQFGTARRHAPSMVRAAVSPSVPTTKSQGHHSFCMVKFKFFMATTAM
jgi:hypothetical protein